MQVAGRAGRAERAGAVILQTHHPDHPLLHTLIGGGYRELARSLLGERRAAGLPPFGSMALLRAEAARGEYVSRFLEAAVARARDLADPVSVHGPLLAPMPRRAGHVRAQVLIESPERQAMQASLKPWLDSVRPLPEARRVRWSIDVDPVEMG